MEKKLHMEYTSWLDALLAVKSCIEKNIMFDDCIYFKDQLPFSDIVNEKITDDAFCIFLSIFKSEKFHKYKYLNEFICDFYIEEAWLNKLNKSQLLLLKDTIVEIGDKVYDFRAYDSFVEMIAEICLTVNEIEGIEEISKKITDNWHKFHEPYMLKYYLKKIKNVKAKSAEKVYSMLKELTNHSDNDIRTSASNYIEVLKKYYNYP